MATFQICVRHIRVTEEADDLNKQKIGKNDCGPNKSFLHISAELLFECHAVLLSHGSGIASEVRAGGQGSGNHRFGFEESVGGSRLEI